MRKTIRDQYRNKLKKAEDAVKVVKSGDWVYYSHFVMFPVELDRALAGRVGEMEDVKVVTSSGMYPCQVAAKDPERKTFTYQSSFLSANDRKLAKQGLCFFIPSNYNEQPFRVRNGYSAKPDVVMVKTTAMDDNGFFNFGTSNSFIGAAIEMADKVIVEVNEAVPRCLGGHTEHVHISNVDMVVEAEKAPLMTIANPVPSDEDRKMAELIISEIPNGACLQLGIGGIPNTVGSLIADSDLQDFGVHSEMMCDAFMDLYDKGKITNRYKYTDSNKIVYTFCIGSKELYEFLDNNPACASYPVDYTNSAENIARNPNTISINNALQVDLYGQIASEAIGTKQVSGSGGQGDFVFGSYKSKGGKAFICLRSTQVIDNERVSRIVPDVQGIVSVARANSFYVVTEYGMVCLKGKATWQMAEGLIAIAHPDFRDDLIRAAERKGIWRRSNKIA